MLVVNQPLMWGAAAAVVVLAPMLGFGLRRVFDRMGAQAAPEQRDRSFRQLVLRLGRDLSVPIVSLTGLLIAVSIPSQLPIAPEVARNTLTAALIIAITFAVARLAADIITSIVLAVSGIGGSASLFATITRVAVFAIGIMITLSSIGVEITPLLGALGIGGLAVALALQSTLANIFAGMHILASKMAQPGDFIRLDSGEEGWLHDVNWRNTTIEQVPGNLVIVPNAKFSEAILTNFNRPSRELSVPVDIVVSCDNDLDLIEALALEVGREIMETLDTAVAGYEPEVRFRTFGDAGIGFQVLLRARQFSDQGIVTSEFIQRLHRRFRRAGVDMQAPHNRPETQSVRVGSTTHAELSDRVAIPIRTTAPDRQRDLDPV